MNRNELISEKRHIEDQQGQLCEAYRQGMPVDEELEAQIEANFADIAAELERIES